MLSLMDKQEIIISHFLEGKSQWEIHRRTGFARKTIRKYINQYEKKRNAIIEEKGDIEVLINDIVETPRYDSSNRSKNKLTNEIKEKIDFYLQENEVKRKTGMSKQQKKKIDIHECLIEEGFDISYSTVCNYIREVLKDEKEAFIRQEYKPGDVAEFDWGYVNLEIDEKQKVVQMAVIATAKGNYRFAYLYHNQKMESFLDAHVRFFNHVDGVHKTLVYDNMKVAVAKFVSRTEKEPTEELLRLSMYYGFKYRFCNVRRGNEKGHVEKSVEYVRRKAFSKKHSFKSLEEANNYLAEILENLNNKPNKIYNNKTPKEILDDEKPYLINIIPSYDIARVEELRVNKYSVITIDENKYSVPDALVGKFVSVKIYPGKIIAYHNNVKVAEHIRNYGRQTWNIQIEHYLKTLKKKPGALHSSTAMQQMNPKLQTIYNKYYTTDPKDFIDLIEIISENGLEKIEAIIAELEKISPLSINTEKVKMLCNRNEESKVSINNKNKETTEIEERSKFIMNQYASILNKTSVAFYKEVTIL